jgi:hypothetical protein
MTARTILTVTMQDGVPVLEATPTAAIDASVSRSERLVRVALRGRGDVEVRFSGMGIADVDVRGGYVFAIPGEPYVVRAHGDGRLSISARLHRR